MALFSKLKNNLHLIIFGVFSIFQCLIIDKIVLFGDDYYYTTFFYEGAEHFISENVYHWMNTNGRAFVHLLDEILLFGGTITAWKIFAAICIPLIALLCALIASAAYKNGIKTAEFKISLIISCISISFISILIAHQTLYWATGFLNYVFPILMTLLLFYFTERAFIRENFPLYIIPLALFACATTEQNAFASLCILIFYGARMLMAKKKPGICFYIAISLGIVGFVSLFAAPGNAVRTTYYADFYSLPFFERIFNNIQRILSLIFKKSGSVRALVIFFGASAVYALKIKKLVIRWTVTSVNAISAVFLICLAHLGRFEGAAAIASLIAFVLDMLMSLAVSFVSKDISVAFFTIMGAAMQGAMLISPEMGPRTLIVTVIFLIIPCSHFVMYSKSPTISMFVLAALLMFMTEIGIIVGSALLLLLILAVAMKTVKKARGHGAVFAVLILAVLMCDSLMALLSGYSQNYAFHKENAVLLSEYKQSIENGGDHILIQKYLPNGTHKYTMPYDDPYHMHWFKIAKKLPIDTQIIYE